MASKKKKESSMNWQDAFFSELDKIAQASNVAEVRENIQDLAPGPRSLTERATPLAGTIGGTMAGSAALRGLGAGGGWKGKALRGLGGLAGGLAGLGLGGAGQKAMVRDRRLDAYEALTGRRPE